MKVSYEKTMEHSFLLIEASDYKRTFEEEMLKRKIHGILPVKKECKNGVVTFEYQITQKQSLPQYTRHTVLDYKLICSLLKEIIKTMKLAKSYLLESDNFLLSHEHIYVGEDGNSFWLCYYIGYHCPIQEQFVGLFETWMKLIDYADRKTVTLVYELYGRAKKSTCTYDQIIEVIERTEQEYMVVVTEKDDKYKIEESKIEERAHLLPKELREQKEEVMGEHEVLFYPKSSYIALCSSLVIAGVIAAICFKSNVLKGRSGQMDSLKLICMLLMLVVGEAFVCSRIFHKKKQHSCTECESMELSIQDEMEKVEDTVHQEKQSSYDNYRNSEDGGEEQREKSYTRSPAAMDEESTQVIYVEEETQLLYEREQLRLVPKEDNLNSIPIGQAGEVIGSSSLQATICIAQRTISRVHAEIKSEQGDFYVKDMESTNGTFLNEVRLEPGKWERLGHEDILQFAEVTYQVLLELKI